MALTDPIADMLTILRNATRAGHSAADVKRSKLTTSILEVLKREHYIYDFKMVEGDAQGIIRVYIKAPATMGDAPRVRRIREIIRVSKPGLRIYATSTEIPRVLNGLGLCVVSTSKGVMTGQQARRGRIGGEVLLKVW